MIHYLIGTIGEPETDRCITAIGTGKKADDLITVFSEGVPEHDLNRIREILSFYSNSTLVQVEASLHIGQVRNFMHDRAEGEWLVHVDADEIPEPTFFREIEGLISKALSLGKDCVLVNLKHRVLSENGQVWAPTSTKSARIVRKSCRWVKPKHESCVGPSMDSGVTFLHLKRMESYRKTDEKHALRFCRDYAVDIGIAHEVYVDNCYKISDDVSGKAVIDIGAHIGLFSILAADRGAVEIHSCECDPLNFEKLKENLSLYGHLNVRLYQSAAWSKSGVSLPMDRFDRENKDSNTGGGTVASGHGSLHVTSIALDDIIANCSLPIGFLKLDCEGSEYEVMYNSKRFTEATVIGLEWHEMDWIKTDMNNRSAMKSFLEKSGYDVDDSSVHSDGVTGIMIARKRHA
jgi:FkbM family methyltransferase